VDSLSDRLQQKQYPLNNLGQRILNHWKEHRPKEYQALKASGELLPHVYALQERGLKLRAKGVEDGLHPSQIEELVGQEVFPPSEEEQPLLGESPEVTRTEAEAAKRKELGERRKTSRSSQP
jgi:hypothetical protein